MIRGDAKLNFRQVREVMQAVEQTGFRGVGLIAKGRSANPAAVPRILLVTPM